MFKNYEIGGYFQLELPNKKYNLHNNSILLNSGVNSFEFILRTIKDISVIWIPYYTCDIILKPIISLGIEYRYYHINEYFEIKENIKISKTEYILYTNYFGIKDKYIDELDEIYGNQLILDCAQALYYNKEIKGNIFYSPRKFIGIPDGGIAIINNGDANIEYLTFEVTYEKCMHLLARIDVSASYGYDLYNQNEITIANQPIKRMSKLSTCIMNSVNHNVVKKNRMENFQFLHNKIGNMNQLKLNTFDEFSCPMVYPFISKNKELRKKLICNKIYVATYWPNVLKLCNETDFEYLLTKDLIPIPIDQRYGLDEMKYIANIIKS